MLQGGFDSGRRFGRRFGPFLAKSRSFSRCQARSGPGRVFGRGRFSGERKIFLVRLFFSAGVNLPRVRPRARPVPSIFFFFFFFFFFFSWGKPAPSRPRARPVGNHSGPPRRPGGGAARAGPLRGREGRGSGGESSAFPPTGGEENFPRVRKNKKQEKNGKV